MSKLARHPRRPSSQYFPPLVVSIHGIRTWGQWQKTLAAVISGTPSKVEAFDYGRYGLIRFLTPGFNNRKIDEFYEWYSGIVKACRAVNLDQFDKRPSLVAHSFGTWIVCYAMLKYEDIRFDKIILCGSILPRDFDWSTLFARDQVGSVRNECGQKDPWPGWAQRLVARAGTAGTDGFDWFPVAVQNVRFEEFHHSEFYRRQHIEKHWVPYLLQVPSPLTTLSGRNIKDGPEFLRLLDYATSVIDREAFGPLEQYADVDFLGRSLAWAKINPDVYTFLIDRKSRGLAGYIAAVPMDGGLYADIRGDRIRLVPSFGIVPFSERQSTKLCIVSIAILERYRRWGEGLFQLGYIQLLTGFLDMLVHYARNKSVRITHVMTHAWTEEGRMLCEAFRMKVVGEDRYGHPIFELALDGLDEACSNLPPLLKRLLRAYRDNPEGAHNI